jgi:hypothetical protein
LDGEPVKVSIVNGIAKIRFSDLDMPMPGVFGNGDIEGVIAAYTKQIEEVDAAFDALPDGWRPPSWGPHDGLDAFDDIDLPEAEDSSEVVYLHGARRDG